MTSVMTILCIALFSVFHSSTAAVPTCPPNKPLVECFVDPCSVNSCPRHPEATCVADYCGGCNARFFDSSGKEVTRSCGAHAVGSRDLGHGCPPGVPLVECFVDPCRFSKCPAHPYAICIADYCGGCNAKFFDRDGKEVTRSCNLK